MPAHSSILALHRLASVMYCYYITKNDDESALPFSAFCTPLSSFGDRKQKQRVRCTTSVSLPLLLPAAYTFLISQITDKLGN